MRKTMIIILLNVVDTDRKSDRQEEQSIDYTWYDQVYLKGSLPLIDQINYWRFFKQPLTHLPPLIYANEKENFKKMTQD